MNSLMKRLTALGATSIIAVSGALLVEPWESTKNHAYKDIVGIPTICAGYTIGVKMGDYKTDEECAVLLVEELTDFNTKLNKSLKRPLPEHMEVAYTSLIWNIGVGAWNNSSILKKINNNDLQGACEGLLAWNKVTVKPSQVGKYRERGETCTLKKNGDYSCTVQGLTNRRLADYKVCVAEDKEVVQALEELKAVAYTESLVERNAIEAPEIPLPDPSPPEAEISKTDDILAPRCTKKFLFWCLSETK